MNVNKQPLKYLFLCFICFEFERNSSRLSRPSFLYHFASEDSRPQIFQGVLLKEHQISALFMSYQEEKFKLCDRPRVLLPLLLLLEVFCSTNQALNPLYQSRKFLKSKVWVLFLPVML